MPPPVSNSLTPSEPYPKRIRGKLPRKTSRRVPASELVYQPVRRSQEDRRLEKGVQRRTATQQPRLQNASRVCTAKQRTELWKRRGRRPLGKRLRLFHS